MGKDTAREELKNSEEWLFSTLPVSTLLPQTPSRISLSFLNPLNTTIRVKNPTGLSPFCRWLVPH